MNPAGFGLTALVVPLVRATAIVARADIGVSAVLFGQHLRNVVARSPHTAIVKRDERGNSAIGAEN